MSSERLEQQIIDALRRAPGPEPGAALDAAILARARAAVGSPRRASRPGWLSLAAGVVVLVGSGMALRIWQQVEHMPSALDAPATSTVPAPPARAPAANGEPIGEARHDGAASDISGGLRKEEAADHAAPDTSDRLDRRQPAPGGRSEVMDDTAQPASVNGPGKDVADLRQTTQKQAEERPALRGADAAFAPPPPLQKAETPITAASTPAGETVEAEALRDLATDEGILSKPGDSASAKLAESAPAAAPPPAPEPAPAPKPAPAPIMDAAPMAAPEMSAKVVAPPAEPAEPFPAVREEDAERSGVTGALGSTRDLLQQAGDVQQQFARIRELLAAGQDVLALAELQALRHDHPQTELPADLRAALERLERKP